VTELPQRKFVPRHACAQADGHDRITASRTAAGVRATNCAFAALLALRARSSDHRGLLKTNSALPDLDHAKAAGFRRKHKHSLKKFFRFRSPSPDYAGEMDFLPIPDYPLPQGELIAPFVRLAMCMEAEGSSERLSLVVTRDSRTVAIADHAPTDSPQAQCSNNSHCVATLTITPSLLSRLDEKSPRRPPTRA